MYSDKLARTVESQYIDVAATSVAGPQLPLQSQEPTLLDYLHVVVKRKWTILSCVVVVTVLVALVSFRQVPVYDAFGRIAINPSNSSALGFKTAEDSYSEDWDYTVTLDTQAKILESDALALETSKALQLDKDPRFAGALAKTAAQQSKIPLAAPAMDSAEQNALLSRFRTSLKVKVIPRTRILEIHYMDANPKLAAQIVNTLASVYIEHNFKTKFESTRQTSDWLSQQLSDLQLKVETSQQRLVDFQKEHGILGIDEKQNIITAKLDQLNRDLTAAETDRINKEALYRTAATGNPELLLKESELLTKLRTQEAELQAQHAQARTQYGPSYPKVRELSNGLKQIQANIQGEATKLMLGAKNDYDAAVRREQMLRAALEDQKKQANQLNENAVQFNIFKRDFESNRQLFEGLQQRLKEAGVSASLRSSNIQIIDQARVPVVPAQPNIPRNLAVGFFLSLAGGIGLAFVMDMLDSSVKTAEQVEMISGLPTLGVIPSNLHLNGQRSRALRALRPQSLIVPQQECVETMSYFQPKSEIAEAYRTLRTSILLSSMGRAPGVVLVTSALAQEGKTTTSINTAVVLAQKGARVLLIDADLRRPSIHKVFGIGQSPGLSEYLTGNTPHCPIMPWAHLPNLSLLPAGATPPYPAELLGSAMMTSSLAEWRKEYDHIVIDTPPALSVTDAVLMSVQADAVILVIRSGQTPKQALRRARYLLSHVNARIVGVVVNAIDLHGSDYYYYYGYYGRQGAYKSEA
jgi:capsular exopolysaccharide synthesis family protein